MSLDWTTLALEMLNFLVLLWILKRFFYAPVLAALDARQQRLRDQATRATRTQAEAAQLKTRYEERLADWQREREEARRQLEQELVQLRTSGMAALEASLADEEAAVRARAAAGAASHEAALLREAAEQAYGSAAAMLRRLASPQLTLCIAAMFCEDLAALPDAEQAALRKAAADLAAGAAVEVSSAHALDAAARDRLMAALAQAAARPLTAAFRETPELVAGLRVAVGECLLHANLADELAFFKSRGAHA